MMSFKSLVSVVSEQRQEIKQGLRLIPYFETWEPELIAECCRVSSVVEFPPDGIILGPDTGNSHAVYFILEGVCKILKNLFAVTSKGSYEKKALYKLCKYFPSTDTNIESKKEGYVSRLLQNENFLEKAKTSPMEEKKTKEMIEGGFFFHKEESSANTRIDGNALGEMKNENLSTPGILLSIETDKKKVTYRNEINSKSENPETPGSGPTFESERKKKQGCRLQGSEILPETSFDFNQHLMVLEECKKKKEDMIRINKKTCSPQKPKNVKCFFVQIGFLLRGACFGLHKSEIENYTIAVTKVKCLKIPRRFLLEHNPCNIWNRIRLFQSLHFPREEEIFDYFCFDRMWLEKKKILAAKIISTKNPHHYTPMSEVPYSIRLTDPQ